MKLSTAIRIGSMTTKQITGHATDGGNGRCAIGAAIDACGVRVKAEAGAWLQQFDELFPRYGDICSEVWHRNDGEGRVQMTREALADWVEAWEHEHLDHDGYVSAGVAESKPLELIAMEAK